MTRYHRLLLLIAIVLAIGLLGFFALRRFAYSRVESLTEAHASEFAELIDRFNQERENDEVEYFKVFEYDGERAKLFIVVRDRQNHRLGTFHHLRKQGGHWKITRIELVWASHGSADGFTWPPYW